MIVKGQLKDAQLHNTSSDLTGTSAGLTWLNTTTNLIKSYVGGAIRTLVTTDQTQTLTNKTLTSPTITGPTITGATLDGDDNTFQDIPLTAIKTDLANASKIVSRDASGVIQNQATITLAQGGTGQSTKAAAFDALSPLTTSGDILYGGASGTGTRLPKGANGQFLTLNSGLPAWGNVSVTQTIQTKSSNYTVLNTDDAVICTAALTLTMYLSSTGTKPVVIINNSSTDVVTINFSGSDTCWGETSQTLPPYSGLTLWPDQVSKFGIV